ncbi:MAG: hypothetical protein HY752_02500 [Nitrospirae bacterium]|nr:hypothetical protein [Nitrospirota bacterium]
MKRSPAIYGSIIILVLSLTRAYADEKEIHKLLSLPEKKIDIGIAALIIAKDIFPDLDVNAYSQKIDEMVAGARFLTKGRMGPDYRVKALNTYFFKIAGIKYDYSDPYGKNTRNRYIDGVLDRKRGNCASMPVLYLAIAQRLGYPVYAVAAPDHLFLRYVIPDFKENNIEATGGGGYSSNEEYIRDFQISKIGIKSGAYLRTLSHRELLAELVSENAGYWIEKGDIKKGIRYLELCVKINPHSPEITGNLGAAYYRYRMSLPEAEGQEFIEKGYSYKRKAKEMGVVRLPQEEYIKQVKKKAKEETKK